MWIKTTAFLQIGQSAGRNTASKTLEEISIISWPANLSFTFYQRKFIMNAFTKLISIVGLVMLSAFSFADTGGPKPFIPQPTPPVVTHSISGTVTAMPVWSAKNAVVYLEDAPVGKVVSPTITNYQMNFLPYVAVSTVGAQVVFTNNDPFPHNVFTSDRERWDLGQILQHQSVVKTFTKEAVYILLCNLHPNMKGYLVVVPTSYFGKTDVKGDYTISSVPAGTYKITAWGPGVKPVTQSVDVTVSDGVSNFDLHR
jgi:plastocyanin